jgi:serine protease
MRLRLPTFTLAFALAAASAAPGLATPAPAAPPAPVASDEGPDFVPGELLVRFDGGPERVMELPTDVGAGEAAAALRQNPQVAYAQPNYIARTSLVPNDPGRGTAPGDWRATQWNFLPCGSLCGESSTPLPYEERGGINAIDAWDILKQRGHAGARGVKVAVVDTGVAFRTDKPGFLKSPDFARKQFELGYDFVKKNRLPLDRDGHGTHVTGTIAERTGNRFGVTGLAYRAKVIPVRVLNGQGFGNARDISAGIRYAAKSGAQVINMSFEFSGAVNACAKIKDVCAAIKFAFKRGAVVTAAAGNSNGEPVAFPAGAPHVIGVGRTTKDACLAESSRTGAGLDLVAPGGGLPLSPACGNDDLLFDRGVPVFQLTFDSPNFRSFGYPLGYEGTSMASAHAAGVAAMVIASRVLGKSPSPVAVECQLKATARSGPGELGQPYDARSFGAGLIDARAAVSSRAPNC